MKNQYLFQLGAMSSLCWAELQAVFPSAVLVQPHLALLESSDNLDAQATIAKLGGTVKIAQVLKQLPSSSTKEEIIAAASFLLQKDRHRFGSNQREKINTLTSKTTDRKSVV